MRYSNEGNNNYNVGAKSSPATTSGSATPAPIKGESDGTSSVMGSDWIGLNGKLYAYFYPVKSELVENSSSGQSSITYVRDVDKNTVVRAPLKNEGTKEFTGTWTSPFEGEQQSGKFPLIASMLQAGAIAPIIQAAVDAAGAAAGGNDVGKNLLKLQGRTSITRLNSTQTYSGMPPVKITITMIFRAYSDAISEVLEPVKQLLKWSLPQKLSPDGRLVTAMKSYTDKSAGSTEEDKKDEKSAIEKGINLAFPSAAPQILGYQFANEKYIPVVIESIGLPVSYPMDSQGNPIYMEVQVTFSSLGGVDADDVDNMMGGANIA